MGTTHLAFTERRLVRGRDPDVVWNQFGGVDAFNPEESLASLSYDNLDDSGDIQPGTGVQLRVSERAIRQNVPRLLWPLASQFTRVPIGFRVVEYSPPKISEDGVWLQGERIDETSTSMFKGRLTRLVSVNQDGSLMQIQANFNTIKLPRFNPESLLRENIRKLLADTALNLTQRKDAV